MTKRDNENKLKMSKALLMPYALNGIHLAVEASEEKYGSADQKGWLDYDPHQVMDSMMRHMEKLESGEVIDKDSELPHRFHIVTNAAILCEILAPTKAEEPSGGLCYYCKNSLGVSFLPAKDGGNERFCSGNCHNKWLEKQAHNCC